MKGHAVHPKKIQDKAPKLLRGGNFKHGGHVDEEEEREEKEEKNRGGRAGKNVGGVAAGAKGRAHGGRLARKSGGTCEDSPFSSARNGTPAPGRKVQKQADG